MNYVLGAGIHGLIMGYLTGTPVIGSLDGQSHNSFPLGPRILHKDEYSEILLNKLGIDKKPRIFKIGHFEGSLQNGKFIDEPSSEWKEKYITKTRGKFISLSSAMSGGKKEIVGWDLNEIHLTGTLLKNIELINEKVEYIDTFNRIIQFKNPRFSASYEMLFNTLNLKVFNNLVGFNFIKGLVANEVNFLLCSGGPLIRIHHDFDYVYFSDIELPFNRVTYINDNLFVIEKPYGSEKFELDTFQNMTIHKKITIPNCQIISPQTMVNEHLGIKMVGRYAKWNHGILINDTIKEGLEYAKSLCT